MEPMDAKCLDVINKLNIQQQNSLRSPVNLYWVLLSCGSNRYTQNHNLHTHTFYEVHFSLEGTMIYGFEDREITIRTGEYLIIPPRLRHSVITNGEDFRKISVSFSIEEMPNQYRPTPAQEPLVRPCTPDITANFDFILRQASERGMFYRTLIEKRLSETIFLVLSDLLPAKTAEPDENFPDPRFLRARKYILDNPEIFFSCSEVADYCHMSVKQLSRLFERFEQKSLAEFIREQKMQETEKLIYHPELSQKEIGQMLGFSSQNYFNKFFVRHFGMTPTEYRKNHLKSKE